MSTLLHRILDKGKQEGIKEGILRGQQSGSHSKALQAAQKMLQRGYPIEEIVEITGLSPEEIASLKDESEG